MGAFVHQACEKAGLPFVVHFHGMDAFAHDLLSRWKAHYTAFFKTAANLVVVSKAMRDQLIRLGAPAQRVTRHVVRQRLRLGPVDGVPHGSQFRLRWSQRSKQIRSRVARLRWQRLRRTIPQPTQDRRQIKL